jgi:hypothetical protein
MPKKNLNNVSKKMIDYFISSGLTEDMVQEIIDEEFTNCLGTLDDLDTKTKDLIVNAINELAASVSNIEELENKFNNIDAQITLVKQKLINTLNNKGFRETIDINISWEDLIGYINGFEDFNYKNKNVYEFTIPNANSTIVLQSDLRGDGSYTVYTDWGDGTVDENTSHTYTDAGVYIVKTKLSVVSLNGLVYNQNTVDYLTDVIDINKNIDNASYMFANCKNLRIIDGNDWLTTKLNNTTCMFLNCTNLIAIYMDNWNADNITTAHNMFGGCTSLYY